MLTKLSLDPGEYTLLAVNIHEGRPAAFFVATVTITGTGRTALVVSEDRLAGKGEAYTRQADGTWTGEFGGTILLCARV
jgi:hypothetical protein